MENKTKFTHLGRPKVSKGTAINYDITRASTLLFNKAEDLYSGKFRAYGRYGSTIHDALKEAFNTLENGAGTSLTPSGLSACTLAIMANVKAGDHILLTDSIYGPTRSFCDNYLKKMDVETERYAPRLGQDIEKLIRKNTSCILLESPGSLTFEIQDLPTIVKVAQKHGIITIMDNTWSGGIVYKPLDLGADISVHAATKYMGGHSDIMFGAVISRSPKIAHKVAQTCKTIGLATSPDDAYQILRGFRTLHTRFEAQAQSAYTLAQWLISHPNVQQVLHPALSEHPDHALWQRDFMGAGCLFSFVFNPDTTEKQVLKFMNGLKYFGLGFSYGGFESVAIHCDPQLDRQYDKGFHGPLIRLGCGLEDIEDLKADVQHALNQAFNG